MCSMHMFLIPIELIRRPQPSSLLQGGVYDIRWGIASERKPGFERKRVTAGKSPHKWLGAAGDGGSEFTEMPSWMCGVVLTDPANG